MTADALSVLGLLFGTIWKLFTSFRIPGTDVTPAGWILFTLFVPVVIRLLKRFIDKNASSDSSSSNPSGGGSE